MIRRGDRIIVEAPSDQGRMDRIERAVFAEVDAVGGRSAPRHQPPARSRLHFGLVGVALAAAAAAVLFWAWPDRARTPALAAAEPSLIVTPAGSGSRIALAGAVIDVAGDTVVEVQPGADGSLVLDLRRGAVDCDVVPRAGRPPFVVVAGDVRVEVVGTRFSVARGETVRVDVARGAVRVSSPEGVRSVAAGESWSTGASRSAAAAPVPEPEPEPAEPSEAPEATAPEAPAAAPAPRKPPRPPASRDAFAAAQRLEKGDRDAAARAYRGVAGGKDAWAALALYNLAELEASRGRSQQALSVVDEYEKRFPHGANAEDAAWLRVEISRRSGDDNRARRAAQRYLDRFATGTYTEPAQRIVDGETSRP